MTLPGLIPGGPFLGKYQCVPQGNTLSLRVCIVGCILNYFMPLSRPCPNPTHNLTLLIMHCTNAPVHELKRGQGEKKRHENSVACSSVTKGDPLLKIGAMYVVPAPVHNNFSLSAGNSPMLCYNASLCFFLAALSFPSTTNCKRCTSFCASLLCLVSVWVFSSS